MFRPLLRKNKELSFCECAEILTNEKRGVLSVLGENGYPYGMPMNHFYNEQDGKIYFHSGNIGHRLDSIIKETKVSFCVYNEGAKEPNDWSCTVKSVIVFGKIEIITDLQKIVDISTKLSHKFTQDEEYIKNEIKTHAHRTLLLVLTPEHICGKVVKES